MKLSLLRKQEKVNGGTLSNNQSEIRCILSKPIARKNCRKPKTRSINTWWQSTSFNRKLNSLRMLTRSSRMKSLLKQMQMKSWNSRKWNLFSRIGKEWAKLKKHCARFKFKKLAVQPKLTSNLKNNFQRPIIEATAIPGQYLVSKNLAAMIKHMRAQKWRSKCSCHRRLAKKNRT